jgi:hypothetical protein
MLAHPRSVYFGAATAAWVNRKNRARSSSDTAGRALRQKRAASAIGPAKIGSDFEYKLVDGTHRLYLSLAAALTHVPAVRGFHRGTR